MSSLLVIVVGRALLGPACFPLLVVWADRLPSVPVCARSERCA